MPGRTPSLQRKAFVAMAMLAAGLAMAAAGDARPARAADAPAPLLAKDRPVDWWFVFKFNSSKFPRCGEDAGPQRTCPFGGKVQAYPSFSQQFVFASSRNGKLTRGKGCVGATTGDPLGATFDQVYHGNFFFVIWNDQFYGQPAICGKSDSCGAPWGHSKGMLAWNEAGEGFVLQVTTPSWPGAGSKKFQRKKDGNTLGCVKNNNVKFSQHFFALRLNPRDLVTVLKALANASIVTDPDNRQIVHNGGPKEVRDLVAGLGVKSESRKVLKEELSTGVTLISKPSKLHVPPWQMVSALLDQQPNRAATWWTRPKIFSTTKTISKKIKCWDAELETPGPVAIATSGGWDGTEIKLAAGANHAKIGVTTAGNNRYAIFGDLNQQGTLFPEPRCDRSQNGRGGLFFAVRNNELFETVTELLDGETAATGESKKK